MNDYDYKKLDNYHKTTEAIDQTRFVVSFMNRVYGWMFIGLLLTGLIAYFCSESPEYLKFIRQNPNFIYLPLFGGLAVVLIMTFMINRISSFAATLGFLFYAALNGLMFSTLLLAFTGESIAITFLVTAGTFGVMGVYGYVTKSDLTKLGNILLMALIGLIIASVVNFFFQSTMFQFVLSGLGVIIFCGLTAYDTQKIKNIAMGVTDDESQTEPLKKIAVFGALTLYLDFINLFLMLLRFFGQRR